MAEQNPAIELNQDEKRALAIQKLAKAFGRSEVFDDQHSERSTLTRILSTDSAEVIQILLSISSQLVQLRLIMTSYANELDVICASCAKEMHIFRVQIHFQRNLSRFAHRLMGLGRKCERMQVRRCPPNTLGKAQQYPTRRNPIQKKTNPKPPDPSFILATRNL